MSLQEKLQILRKEKGLSQEGLAESMAVSRQAVAKWESGQSVPELDKLIELSDYFKVSLDQLVREAENCSLQEKKAQTPLDTNQEEVIAFLIRAKKATYAGKGAEVEPSRPNSHDLQYREGNLLYIDTYLGGEKFAGEEAIWKDEQPFWSMNYVGRVVGEGFSGDFLKEAMRLVPKETPYRGPMIYKNGDYTYHCQVTGSFEWYQGVEEIFLGEIKVYELVFHGGSVK